MRIVITMNRQCDIKRYLNGLCNKYFCAVEKKYLSRNEIVLVNGDVIKGYIGTMRNDGIRADVAIGACAEIYTCSSKVEEPVWDYKKLCDYLERLHLLAFSFSKKGRCRMNKQIKLSVDMRDIDRIAIGSRLYDALDTENVNNGVHDMTYDKEENKMTVIIKKEKIIDMLKLVNGFYVLNHTTFDVEII